MAPRSRSPARAGSGPGGGRQLRREGERQGVCTDAHGRGCRQIGGWGKHHDKHHEYEKCGLCKVEVTCDHEHECERE
jgi:hypothetical protein